MQLEGYTDRRCPALLGDSPDCKALSLLELHLLCFLRGLFRCLNKCPGRGLTWKLGHDVLRGTHCLGHTAFQPGKTKLQDSTRDKDAGRHPGFAADFHPVTVVRVHTVNTPFLYHHQPGTIDVPGEGGHGLTLQVHNRVPHISREQRFQETVMLSNTHLIGLGQESL